MPKILLTGLLRNIAEKPVSHSFLKMAARVEERQGRKLELFIGTSTSKIYQKSELSDLLQGKPTLLLNYQVSSHVGSVQRNSVALFTLTVLIN